MNPLREANERAHRMVQKMFDTTPARLVKDKSHDHITQSEHLCWCQRCDYQLIMPMNATPRMRKAIHTTFTEEHKDCP